MLYKKHIVNKWNLIVNVNSDEIMKLNACILHFDHHKKLGWLAHILMEQIWTMGVNRVNL